MLSKNILYHGKEEPPVKAIPLRAGGLRMIFDPRRACLRYVRLGDHEIVRAIYGAIRDKDWNTIGPHVLNLQQESNNDHFRLSFDAECKSPGIDFFWQGLIEGDARGEITFSFDGEARSTFIRNRIGICLLHPIAECAGKHCTVEEPDGRLADAQFPRYVSPLQPIKNIRALGHEVVPGLSVRMRFEGDIFETEDQRNWGDASFKTYSTPLEIPFPVEVQSGTRVRQTVTVSLQGESRKILPVVQGRTPQFSIATSTVVAKPPIGLAMASHGQALSAREIERLKKLRLSHLRVDLRLSDPSFRETLRQATQASQQLGASLHVALFLTASAEVELNHLLAELQEARPKVSLWLVFNLEESSSNERWVPLARQKLSALGPNVLMAAGSRSDFVELNRNRPAPESSALPCYGVNPQVHATDDLTIVENIAAQRMTVEAAQQICPRPVVISPVTLRPRSLVKSSGTEGPGAMTELPRDVDPRQMSLLGAAWTLGSIASLATTGHLHSLTYYETTGWRGVMETEHGSLAPEKFLSLAGSVFPVYHVFAEIAGFGRCYPTHSSHPLQVEGLTLIDDQNHRRVLIGNLLAEEQEVKIKTGLCRARIRYLDERNAEEAMRSPESFQEAPGEQVESDAGKIGLKLLPFALASVDIF
jgi:D-apionolactonase